MRKKSYAELRVGGLAERQSAERLYILIAVGETHTSDVTMPTDSASDSQLTIARCRQRRHPAIPPTLSGNPSNVCNGRPAAAGKPA